MASNITSFTAIPDGSPATPSLFNSRFSQAHLNIVSVDSLAHDIQSGAESIATGVIGTIQLADRSVTGVKLATSAVTTRALAVDSVTSLKIPDGGILGNHIPASTITGKHVDLSASRLTAQRMFVTKDGHAIVDSSGLGSEGRFTSAGVYWKMSDTVGSGSENTSGLAMADVNAGVAGAYRTSSTSLVELALFSGTTTYAIAHSAGLVVSNSSTPLGTGTGVVGDFRWGSDNTGAYVYVCVSANSWSRATLHTFG